MTDLVAYPHPIGTRVAFVDCYGENRRDGEVISTPGPYTVRVQLASGAVYWVAADLITGRADMQNCAISQTDPNACLDRQTDAPKPMSIFSTSKEVPKITRPPAPAGQLSLF